MEYYKLNLVEKTLTVSKAFDEKVAAGNTPEYRLYKRLMRDIPDLTIVHRTHNTPKKYNTRTGEVVKGHNKNKGLTYEKMERFISSFSNSNELMEQYEYIKTHSISPYSATVGWFETQFPQFRKNPLFYLNNDKVIVLDANRYLEVLEAAG